MRKGRRTAGLVGVIVFIIVSLPSPLTRPAALLIHARPAGRSNQIAGRGSGPVIARQMLLKFPAQDIGLLTDISMTGRANRRRSRRGYQLAYSVGWELGERERAAPVHAVGHRRHQGWRGNPAYVDAAHRVHARVEDGIRAGKDCGIGRFSCEAMAMNRAWICRTLRSHPDLDIGRCWQDDGQTFIS